MYPSHEALIAISKYLDGYFDNISYTLLGRTSNLMDKKVISISTGNYQNLPNLFVHSLGARSPDKKETEVLKNLLETANTYIEGLKQKTKAQMMEAIGDKSLDEDAFHDRVVDILQGSKTHLKTIAESEATRVRNMGKALNIAKVAASDGEDDPTVYFQIVKDGNTCPSCIKNHTVDGITPKLMKLSEVKTSYLNKEERIEGMCSISGQHPHCRCTLLYLAKGWGFNDKGSLKFISLNYNALDK